MKYLLITAIILISSLLVSKVMMAVNLIHFNKFYTVKTQNKIDEKELIKTGKSMYLVYCSSCHGYDGKGNNGKAQNHTNRIAKKSVLDVIINGSNNFKSLYPAGMPANLINKQDAKEVASYVASSFKGKQPKAWKTCASCHDETGEGIALLAPNIKTYTNKLVNIVLENGKKGVIGTMPSFKGRLSTQQIDAIATYIRSMN